ncbi:MAG: tRNA (N6-isopentenyl adenosine(37)-C2)-methylthiotransferase MiaB, partial [Candidatus Latescibacterota bacterium]|nr:tRNA (N6-isopentenyl adenosine(37)-C2)-methylthiotransferase MiaB [Candidatus Latescibacterota bacterium]
MSQSLPDIELLSEVPSPTSAHARTAPLHHRSVYIETYGCQMNVADTEVVASILSDAGYRIVDGPEDANVILVNTCAVRENAEERVIGRVGQLHGLRRTRPDLTIGVLGCMAQHLTDTLPARAPFVDLIAGPDAYQRLPELLAQTADETLLDTRLSRTENYVGIDPVRTEGTNAWVTIIRGCDKFCTFCVVPYVRGRERSVPSDEILRQVRELAESGFREVTLLGQTVNSYDDGQRSFAQLLDEVAQIDGIRRIRFTSPYPADFNDETIEAMGRLPQVCPSLHLPVQSGSDPQLEAMRRGYSIGEYRQLVQRLRTEIPDLAITTDIIVGFCGESDDDFRQTVELMQEVRFDSAFM